MKRLVYPSGRNSEKLSASNSVILRNKKGPKCCHPILTVIFIALKIKTQQQKMPIGFCLLFLSARAAHDGT